MAMSHRWLRRSVRSRSALRGEQGSMTIGMRWMISLNGRGDATPPASARRRIVIIGAGFGGLSAAQRLARVAADIIVIDRRNHHLFQPLLY
jgi:NADPH-dependent 2,4-dienoyl-CoA reductase/sulfur reductase-like enzyme